MQQTKLEIKKNGEYNNITLKNKYKRQGLKLILDDNKQKIIIQQGLNPGQSCTITKKYAEGKPIETKYGTSYSCIADYEGTEVSFFLKPSEHEKYAQTGGEGDQIIITNTIQKYTHPTLGVELEKEVLTFKKK